MGGGVEGQGDLSEQQIELLRKMGRDAAAAYEVLRPSLDLSTLIPRFDVVQAIKPLIMPNVAAEIARSLGTALADASLATRLIVPELRLADSIAGMLRNQQQAIESVANSTRSFQANFDWVRAVNFTAEFTEYLRRLRPAEWMLASRLEERGWWLIPGMDRTLIDALGTATDDGRKGRVGKLIVDHYSARDFAKLASVVRGWDMPEFKENGRPVIFQQALRALRRGDRAIATTALTLQIEGIVKDFLFREQLIDERARRSAKSPVPLFAEHAVDQHEPSFSGFVRELQALYSQYAGPTGGRRRTNRHGQAHGGEAPNNGATDAVRAFLRLQTLHYHLSRLRQRRGQKAAG